MKFSGLVWEDCDASSKVLSYMILNFFSSFFWVFKFHQCQVTFGPQNSRTVMKFRIWNPLVLFEICNFTQTHRVWNSPNSLKIWNSPNCSNKKSSNSSKKKQASICQMGFDELFQTSSNLNQTINASRKNYMKSLLIDM